MRTNENLFILQRKFGNDLKITATEWETEWNTHHYTITIFLESDLVEELEEEPERLAEYNQDGIAAVMGFDCMFTGETIDEAVESFFSYCHENNLL